MFGKKIKEARQNKSNLAVLWLYITAAFPSIPHKLIELTLKTYHIPEIYEEIIIDYYNRFKVRFTVNGFTTKCHYLQIGIIKDALCL